MTEEQTKTRHIYLEMEDPVNEEDVQQILKEAGINARNVYNMAGIKKGIAVTKVLAESVWNEETGADECNGACGPEKNHQSWQYLNEEQQTTIAVNLAAFLHGCRQDDTVEAMMIDDEEGFEDIKTVPD